MGVYLTQLPPPSHSLYQLAVGAQPPITLIYSQDPHSVSNAEMKFTPAETTAGRHEPLQNFT